MTPFILLGATLDLAWMGLVLKRDLRDPLAFCRGGSDGRGIWEKTRLISGVMENMKGLAGCEGGGWVGLRARCEG